MARRTISQKVRVSCDFPGCTRTLVGNVERLAQVTGELRKLGWGVTSYFDIRCPEHKYKRRGKYGSK
jgi:hypothetical protein